MSVADAEGSGEGSAPQSAPSSNRDRIPQLIFGLLFAVSVIAFIPLYAPIAIPRRASMDFTLYRLLPVMVAHFALFIAALAWRRSWIVAAAVWSSSFVVLLAVGGPLRATAILAAAVVAILAAIAGRGLCRLLFEPDHVKWGISLLTGCALLSVLTSYLAMVHLLSGGVLLLVLCGAAALSHFVVSRQARTIEEGAAPDPNQDLLSKKERRRLRQARRDAGTPRPLTIKPAFFSRISDIPAGWIELILLEVSFLIFSLLLVCASAPELNSDAIRMYIPYLKLLDLHNGFFDIPGVWSYTIPQAGVTYAAGFYAAFGPIVARYSMLVAFVAIAVVISSFEKFSAASLSITIVVITTPFVARLGANLMLDMFVTLTVMLIAAIAIRGKTDNLALFFTGIGAAIGLAWCAKYTGIVYAAPLGLFALWRGVRASSASRAVINATLFVPLGAALTATPWLLHTWRQSGNPFFPLFLNVFPAPLWPSGVLDISAFFPPPGWRLLLMAPVEFTFRTAKYYEGFNGATGLTLIVLFLAALWVFWKGNSVSRILVAAAVIGAAGVLANSSYLRYWMPTILLLGFGVSHFFSQRPLAKKENAGTAAVAIICALLALPVFTASSWVDSKGLPWDFYTRRVSFDDYIARQAGFEVMSMLKKFDPGHPRILFTNLNAVGHWPVIPIEAASWEWRMHGVNDAATAKAWLESYQADYWVVDKSEEQWPFIQKLIGNMYNGPELLIASVGSVELYAMPNSERARSVLQKIAQLPPPTDLSTNGSFEETPAQGAVAAWNLTEGVELRRGGAYDGENYLRVSNSVGATQRVDVSPASAIRLVERLRSNSETARDTRLQINWMSGDNKFITATIDVVKPTREWKEYSMRARVPEGASYAIIYLVNHDKAAITDVDAVQLLLTN